MAGADSSINTTNLNIVNDLASYADSLTSIAKDSIDYKLNQQQKTLYKIKMEPVKVKWF